MRAPGHRLLPSSWLPLAKPLGCRNLGVCWQSLPSSRCRQYPRAPRLPQHRAKCRWLDGGTQPLSWGNPPPLGCKSLLQNPAVGFGSGLLVLRAVGPREGHGRHAAVCYQTAYHQAVDVHAVQPENERASQLQVGETYLLSTELACLTGFL